MRVTLLLTLAACAASTPEAQTRRIVIPPTSEGSRLDARRCQERCAPYLQTGEQATCESVAVHGALEERLGYRDANVCVLRPRKAD